MGAEGAEGGHRWEASRTSKEGPNKKGNRNQRKSCLGNHNRCLTDEADITCRIEMDFASAPMRCAGLAGSMDMSKARTPHRASLTRRSRACPQSLAAFCFGQPCLRLRLGTPAPPFGRPGSGLRGRASFALVWPASRARAGAVGV